MMSRYYKIKNQYLWGKKYLSDPYIIDGNLKSRTESAKTPLRYEIINYLLTLVESKNKRYLEIGVRRPDENFNKIIADEKHGVDPGIEYEENPVEFKMKSDDFFSGINCGDILDINIRFDVIFIDGLHLAEQVERDINNALDFITDDGFIVLHDCNPPTEYHTRESKNFNLSPAQSHWNGTTWKAFYKYRLNNTVSCACIDSDWGIGVISKIKYFAPLDDDLNPFFEYRVLNNRRNESLNLMPFSQFKEIVKPHEL